MAKFAIKNIISLKGIQQFKQLVILSDNEDARKIQAEIDFIELKINTGESTNKSGIINGELDIFEKSLEIRYKKAFYSILSLMRLVADLKALPESKFRDITPKGEAVKEYEFKYRDLRVYGIKILNGKLIVLAGYKNSQRKDITRFRSLKKQYLESL